MISVAEHPIRGIASRSDVAVATQPLRLLVVDDHPAVLRGVRELLEQQPDFSVIDAVATAERAMLVAEREQLDVAVVDYQLGRRNGLWVSRKLKRLPRPPRVVIYSAYSDGLLAAAAVVAEADGLISKGELGSELCDAVRTVSRGLSALPSPPWQLGDVMRRRLDQDEQAVFGMLLAGMTPVEIAATMRISESGLDSRLWEMMRKLETLDVELAASLG